MITKAFIRLSQKKEISEAHRVKQLSLFDVAEAYRDADTLDNKDLYDVVATNTGIDSETRNAVSPVGRSGQKRNLYERKVRWYQQSLKAMGILERVEGRRGVWRLTKQGRKAIELKRIVKGHVLVAFSTRLGVALWAECGDVFPRLDEPIALCMTSPPYPLRQPRAYGNPDETEYVDWLCEALEPIVRNLLPGGSIVLNLGNDIFVPGTPARSMYRERLILALHDRLGLFKMDEIPWVNYSKPPGPVQWASIHRNQLNTAWEPVYWLTNDPSRVRADNRRVLQAHSDRHRRLMQGGGEKRTAEYGDGAYQIEHGDYGQVTAGAIPKNVIQRGHICRSNKAYADSARKAGLPVHGAMYPYELPEFFIRFLSSEDDLVVDPFSGAFTTALAAENNSRRWIGTEVMLEYVQGAAERFKDKGAFATGDAVAR